MQSRQTDGCTLRENLEALQRQGKVVEELLNEPELDDMFYEVWGWFLRLHNKRSSNGFGVNPLQYSEIESFFRLQSYMPQAWEIEIINILDGVALDAYSEQQEKAERAKQAKQKK
jgi:hypothetical protein